MADSTTVVVDEIKEKKKKKSNLKKSSLVDMDVGSTLSSRKSSAITSSPTPSRSPSMVDDGPSLSETIREIMAPKKIQFDDPYEVPTEVRPRDMDALKDIDDRKLIELKEAFKIFDFNGDGFIDAGDLRSMFISLGQEDMTDQQIQQMLDEALTPLDFDAFVVLLGYRTIDLDPEEVLVEALSKWDKGGNGMISEELIRHDLMTYGDRFTEKEAKIALEEAPIAKGTGDGFNCKGPVMIDYPEFCKTLSGLRKRVKK